MQPHKFAYFAGYFWWKFYFSTWILHVFYFNSLFTFLFCCYSVINENDCNCFVLCCVVLYNWRMDAALKLHSGTVLQVLCDILCVTVTPPIWIEFVTNVHFSKWLKLYILIWIFINNNDSFYLRTIYEPGKKYSIQNSNRKIFLNRVLESDRLQLN